MGQKRRRLARRRRACGYSQEAFAEAVRVDRTTVTRWESGETEPQPWHRRRIAAALKISLEELDELLTEHLVVPVGGGYVEATTRIAREAIGQEVEETNRRELLSAGLRASGAVVPGVGSVGHNVPVADTELLTTVTNAYRRLESTHPSGMLTDPVIGCVRLVRDLIRATGGGGRRAHAVLSEAAGLAAWLFADLHNIPAAHQYYQLAIGSAVRSRHPLLPSYMRASLGQFVADNGDAGQGLSLVHSARHGLPTNAPPVARVWLDAVEARVLAQRCDREALALLRRAEDRLETADHEPVWPWLFRFDQAKLAGYRAVCAARLGHAATARAAFAETATVPRARKQHAMLLVEQARCAWETGDAEEASVLAVAALDTAGGLGSERVHHAVRTLRAAIGDHAGAATAEFDHRLAAVYREWV